MPTVMSAKRARTAILRGRAPAGILVQGDLSFDGERELAALPEGLEVRSLSVSRCEGLRALPAGLRCFRLDISGTPLTELPGDTQVTEVVVARRCAELASLPDGLRLDWLDVSDCRQLRSLPAGLRCHRLSISHTPIASLPPDLEVTDTLEADGCDELASLPAGLRLRWLDVSDCVRLTTLPDDLRVTGTLDVRGCVHLERLPTGLELDELDATGCIWLAALPDDLKVTRQLTLSGCTSLEALPPHLPVRRLRLDGCTALRALSEGLDATFLDISGCAALEGWPRTDLGSLRQLMMRNCRRLRGLPPGVSRLTHLDITGCTGLHTLPEELRVSWMEVGDSALESVPPRMESKLRWRGVRVPDVVVLHPEKLAVRDILAEDNTEVRRVMIERMGYERFMYEAGAVILAEDHDPGGPRQLLRVEIPRDEPLVCLAVSDPSTGRQYVLRVPPNMTSCRQAAAWIAGFDDPDEYHPVAET
jgi:hypothetical protein